MTKYLISILFLTLLASCSTKLHVSNLKNIEELEDNAYIYILPKTIIRVKVTTRQTIIKRGPYYQYAESFLGISNVPQKDETHWKLTGIEIDSHLETDPEHYYRIKTKKTEKLPICQLIQEQYILPDNYHHNISTYQYLPPIVNEDVFINDLSMKKNMKKNEKTFYRTIQRDSTTVVVPDQTGKYSTRTTEEKAEEAIHNLIRLRKRRYKLITGITGITKAAPETSSRAFPRGDAVDAMIRELNELETELMALFIGKKIEKTYTRTFEFTPTKNSDITDNELFSFSPTYGIMSPMAENGIPVYLKIQKLNNNRYLNDLLLKQDNEQTKFKHIRYRIPDDAIFRIMMDADILAQKRLPVFQFGTMLNYQPVNK